MSAFTPCGSVRIRSIEYLENFSFELKFDNGDTKVVDFVELSREYDFFSPLLRIEGLFPLGKIELNGLAVVWNDDIDAEACFLYDKGTHPLRDAPLS